MQWNFLFKGEVVEATINRAQMILKSLLLGEITSQGSPCWEDCYHFHPGLIVHFSCDRLGSLFTSLRVHLFSISFTHVLFFSMVFRMDTVLEKTSGTKVVKSKVSFSSLSFISILQKLEFLCYEILWDDSRAPALK